MIKTKYDVLAWLNIKELRALAKMSGLKVEQVKAVRDRQWAPDRTIEAKLVKGLQIILSNRSAYAIKTKPRKT